MSLKTFPLKRAGCCICCSEEVNEIITRAADGTPTRVGRMTARATQLVFLLSDGTTCAITCCCDCAAHLTPADYPAIWRAVITRTALSLAKRSENERRTYLAHYLRLWPLALVHRRREDPESPTLIIDRRAPDAA